MGLPEKHQHTVAVKRCGAYDPQVVYLAICRQLELLGGADCFFKKGHRVLIKPNLIVAKGQDIPAIQPAGRGDIIASVITARQMYGFRCAKTVKNSLSEMVR